jgi:hypothetical protein
MRYGRIPEKVLALVALGGVLRRHPRNAEHEAKQNPGLRCGFTRRCRGAFALDLPAASVYDHWV